MSTFSLEDETAATPSLGSSEAGQEVRPREAEEGRDGEAVVAREPAPTESRGRRTGRRRRGRRRERNAPQPANQAVAGQRVGAEADANAEEEESNSPEAQASPEPSGSGAERGTSEESDPPTAPEVKINEAEVSTMVGTVEESSPARRTRSSVAASLEAPGGEMAGMMVMGDGLNFISGDRTDQYFFSQDIGSSAPSPLSPRSADLLEDIFSNNEEACTSAVM